MNVVLQIFEVCMYELKVHDCSSVLKPVNDPSYGRCFLFNEVAYQVGMDSGQTLANLNFRTRATMDLAFC